MLLAGTSDDDDDTLLVVLIADVHWHACLQCAIAAGAIKPLGLSATASLVTADAKAA